ncbi:uroporphyrinogen-III synthase [Nitrososphaera viennensis]|uniref:Uroporphyrinogen-III synthase n=2 Tax=Nitrososphaera viennensis TaxID=1034015 RepID=A0A060HPI6_9ARCH|nr:uroporphyrinogen-III synthase [Nitrososphaera viennensis]AIC17050.1 uroporphyrinogen-III synthase [Nitrososphaera viennensis EN76]UVS68944.1 uroporphyrinogen-III synthase [Nitrososphaera viennensis]
MEEEKEEAVARVPGLEGKVLAITRGRKEAAEFSRLVKKEGGKAVPIQAIEIVPEGRKAARQFLKLLEEKKHDYCAFMSAQAVAVLFELGGKERIASALESTEVIAVGPKTKQELEKRGVRVAMMPKAFSSIGLVELLSSSSSSSSKDSHRGKKIIIPRSAEAGDYAAKALLDLGMAAVDEVFLYSVRTASITPAWKKFYRMLLDREIDAIVFTSASNVRSFFEIVDRLGGVRVDRLVQAVVSIGPFTSAELKRRKVRHREAKHHTVEGTVQAAKKLLVNTTSTTSRSG